MNMMFDARIFEDLNQRLLELGKLCSSEFPQKSKDRSANRMIQEARLYSFLACHNSLQDLFVSIFEQTKSDAPKTEDQRNVIGEVLMWLYKDGSITKEQAGDLVEQFESAAVLSMDLCWLDKPEEKEVFEHRAGRISRYYYTMSTFIGKLTQKVIFTPEGKNNARAE